MTWTPQDFKFLHPLRVRWSEVDMQKIVFNAHYLTYLDTAMAAYWRALALPYSDTMESLGGDLFVKKATLEYHAPALYDEGLQVALRLQSIGTSSLRFDGAVFREGVLLTSAELIYVFADPQSRTSLPVPLALKSALSAWESGAPAVNTTLGDWQTHKDCITPLRHAVFAKEQGIAADLVCDAADESAVHVMVCNGLGRAVSSGRLLVHAPGTGRIGRMVTDKALRGQGLARTVLHALMEASRQRGDSAIVLHAQASAVGFYLKEGFKPVGPEFVEAGIAHQEMELRWALTNVKS
ncbi:YbgC/FadM family acyl-CoA thioesterase [Rhodoferax sp.]|uniref:YbgC/FadM family acyl-CoA thioesterase n=1 Tax=Rhodoferax sp. TaxID=50421 RepID=UPI0025F24753|nr:YbgC/FadM family acyl-CoA thioesterase [Rhodoferax sp.]